jgi:enoyl-CoA hydratase
MYETLLYQVDTIATDKNGKEIEADGLAIITLNRPDKLNALNALVLQELERAVLAAQADEHVKGIIITGAGERAFVAGADISEFQGLTQAEAHDLALRGQGIFNLIEQSTKPVVAAVNGFALGGGCELALACHLRIASESAKFGQPEVNLGLIPGYGGTQRLPRVVGRGVAMQMILSGQMISAQRAFQVGLVNQVLPQIALLSAAKTLLRSITSKAPVAVAQSIQAILAAEQPIQNGLATEAELFGKCFDTEDFREGVNAFLEKRSPEFKGK